MADTTITGLTAVLAANLDDTAVLPVDDKNGNTRKATVAQLRTAIAAAAIAFLSTVSVAGATTLTGNVGVGSAPAASVALYVISGAMTSADQRGGFFAPAFSSAATATAYALYAALTPAAGAFTVAAGHALSVGVPTVNNTAITNIYGLRVENQGQAKSTNAYGVYISAQSGAATTNIGLYNAGTTHLVGSVGVGATGPGTTVGLYVKPTSLTGTVQYGIYNEPVFTSAATSEVIGIRTLVRTAAAAFTATNGYGINVAAPTIGAASAVTTLSGIYINNQGASGVTNAYGVYISAQSGAATTNIGLYNAGTTTLVGAVLCSSTLNVVTSIAVNGKLFTFGANDSAGAGYRTVTMQNA